MSRRGLLVVFEGLPDTVIDSQVLIHAREMRELGFVDFEVWSFACSADLYRHSLGRLDEASRLSGGTVRLFRGVTVRPAMPATSFLNALLLERNLRRLRPRFDLIHARTDYAAVVCSHLKRLRSFELVWDCRGDCVAEFRFTYDGWRDPVSLLRRDLGTLVLRRRIRRAIRLSDRASFVSEMLRVATGAPAHFGEIIPSTASSHLFFFDPELRARMREKLEYPRGAKVLVYSGSLKPYQCFPETVQLFHRIHEVDPSVRFLVLTPDLEPARTALADLPPATWHLASVPIEEVNAYLNAADTAVMLRREHPLNQAATPTKFAEYGLTGLPVLLHPGVTEVYRVAHELGLGIDYDPAAPPPTLCSSEPQSRSALAARAGGRLARAAILPRYRRLYGLPDEPVRTVAPPP